LNQCSCGSRIVHFQRACREWTKLSIEKYFKVCVYNHHCSVCRKQSLKVYVDHVIQKHNENEHSHVYDTNIETRDTTIEEKYSYTTSSKKKSYCTTTRPKNFPSYNQTKNKGTERHCTMESRNKYTFDAPYIPSSTAHAMVAIGDSFRIDAKQGCDDRRKRTDIRRWAHTMSDIDLRSKVWTNKDWKYYNNMELLKSKLCSRCSVRKQLKCSIFRWWYVPSTSWSPVGGSMILFPTEKLTKDMYISENNTFGSNFSLREHQQVVNGTPINQRTYKAHTKQSIKQPIIQSTTAFVMEVDISSDTAFANQGRNYVDNNSANTLHEKETDEYNLYKDCRKSMDGCTNNNFCPDGGEI